MLNVNYTCSKCDDKSKWKVTFLSHLRSVHEGVKYPCIICDHEETFDRPTLTFWWSSPTDGYAATDSFAKALKLPKWNQSLY